MEATTTRSTAPRNRLHGPASPGSSAAGSAQVARAGMTFGEFYQRFGGSFRTKNLCLVPNSLGGRMVFAARTLLGRAGKHSIVNKRLYAPPGKSALPGDFIRLDPWEAEYLFMMAAHAKKAIVEVGRFFGGSTFLMACANQKAPIYSIDIAPQDDARLKRFLTEHNVGQNLELIVGDSQRGVFPHIDEIDLLFVDGDHSYQGCTLDLENHYPKVVRGGHVLLHDCYFGCDVQNSVIDFTAKHNVNVVRSPHIIASHWHTSYGSMAHFSKAG